MTRQTAEVHLEVQPRHRWDVIDVAERIRRDRGEVLARFRHVLYCSHHTTAGFLSQPDARRLRHRLDRMQPFLESYHVMFPADAGYRHDAMELRRELSPDQQLVEPANGDSHLVFIGAGLESCVSYANDPDVPVFFVDLDGVCRGRPRTRRLTAVGYTEAHEVAQVRLEVPVSGHAIDSVNLLDRRLGIAETLQRLSRACPCRAGRIELCLDPHERDAALTINEYETLLMRHDLAEVLRDPLRFAARQGRRALRNPGAVPKKSRGYARYDLVLLMNRTLDALHLGGTMAERLLARAMAVPARARLRLRRSVSLPVVAQGRTVAGLVRGRFQSPILMQWRPSRSPVRVIHATLIAFR